MFENEDGNGDDYEVEFIQDHRGMARGKREFYVHWKGWPTSDDSWVDVANVTMDCGKSNCM